MLCKGNRNMILTRFIFHKDSKFYYTRSEGQANHNCCQSTNSYAIEYFLKDKFTSIVFYNKFDPSKDRLNPCNFFRFSFSNSDDEAYFILLSTPHIDIDVPRR
jgi:hypothetical protein